VLFVVLVIIKTQLVTVRANDAKQEHIRIFKENHFVCYVFLDFIKTWLRKTNAENAVLGNFPTKRH